MNSLNYLSYYRTAMEHRRAGDIHDDRGAVSTEMAVVTAAFVAIAIAGGVIFMNRAESNANNIPGQVDPPAANGVVNP